MKKDSSNKILLLVPAETASGGIKNYFQVLENSFSLPVEYMIRGSRNWPYRNSFLSEIKRAYLDLSLFKKRINKGDIKLIQTSTSLGSFSVIRDGLFINAAKKKGLKTIAFFRGWDLDFESKLEKKYLKIFKRYFFKVDAIIVLSSLFKNKLIEWGYEGKIYIETTIVDEALLKDVNKDFIRSKTQRGIDKINILFLARAEKAKGIYEAIKSFHNLKKKFPNIELTVAGDGFELEPAKKFVSENNILNVSFTGEVLGDAKAKAFRNANIYLFPSYTEGLPNSVLEAMTFGLPIVATRVGGLNDILEDNKTGFFIEKYSVDDIEEKVQLLLDNFELLTTISMNNYLKGISSFTTNNVIKRVEIIYSQILADAI